MLQRNKHRDKIISKFNETVSGFEFERRKKIKKNGHIEHKRFEIGVEK
jgi:hypothetical protein